ncbi:hypothetical protein BDV3_003079 [Batrachochytrium dendrobatidis]|uniref:C2H2-type domain-containing protein n=1 Tax=Batrachochytrium dendrobatidis (strain JEL423) TaxID=403673 RepID=A0A177WXF3_BATDL|nr:hypothetical protein BDEG_27964 [Batrachochytrium dendrobatidis JEL423]
MNPLVPVSPMREYLQHRHPSVDHCSQQLLYSQPPVHPLSSHLQYYPWLFDPLQPSMRVPLPDGQYGLGLISCNHSQDSQDSANSCGYKSLFGCSTDTDCLVSNSLHNDVNVMLNSLLDTTDPISPGPLDFSGIEFPTPLPIPDSITDSIPSTVHTMSDTLLHNYRPACIWPCSTPIVSIQPPFKSLEIQDYPIQPPTLGNALMDSYQVFDDHLYSSLPTMHCSTPHHDYTCIESAHNTTLNSTLTTTDRFNTFSTSHFHPFNSSLSNKTTNSSSPITASICLTESISNDSSTTSASLYPISTLSFVDSTPSTCESSIDLIPMKPEILPTIRILSLSTCSQKAKRASTIIRRSTVKQHLQQSVTSPATSIATTENEFTLSESKSDDDILVCKVSGCRKLFDTSHNLRVHARCHLPLVQHLCPTCDYGFRRLTDLHRHIRTMHTPENLRPWQCSYCNRRFGRSDALRRHLLSRERSLTCPPVSRKKSIQTTARNSSMAVSSFPIKQIS